MIKSFFMVNKSLILIIKRSHKASLKKQILNEYDEYKRANCISFYLGHVLRIGDHKHPRWWLFVDGHDVPADTDKDEKTSFQSVFLKAEIKFITLHH